MPSIRVRHVRILAFAAAVAAPALAAAAPITPGGVFAHAPPVLKLIIVALVAMSLAAVAVCARKLASRDGLAGGSAYLSGLRLGGPLLGLLGGAWTGVNIAVGVANAQGPVPMAVLAPGIAEAVTLLAAGLLAGVVAAICHWAVEARIDRAVLKA